MFLDIDLWLVLRGLIGEHSQAWKGLDSKNLLCSLRIGSD